MPSNRPSACLSKAEGPTLRASPILADAMAAGRALTVDEAVALALDSID